MTKIIVLTENLLRETKKIKISTISNLPVLNYCHIIFKNGFLYLTTTNLEKTNTVKVGCRIEDSDDFELCVPMVKLKEWQEYIAPKTKKEKGRWAKYRKTLYPFYDFLKVMETCPCLIMEFDAKLQELKITTREGNSKTIFKCLDAENFPKNLIDYGKIL